MGIKRGGARGAFGALAALLTLAAGCTTANSNDAMSSSASYNPTASISSLAASGSQSSARPSIGVAPRPSTNAPVAAGPASTSAAQAAPDTSAIVVAGSILTSTAPAPGSCHARKAPNGQPLPDPACTPGAINRAVTQANIHSTISVSGYTSKVRPPESVTEAFKLLAEKACSTPGGELDHLIPLELGGSSDAHDLWVEPGSIPNPKDTVENDLHAAVCARRVSLATAQQFIATDWTTALARISEQPAPTTTPPAPKVTTTAPAMLRCSASMSNASPAQNSTTDVLVTTTAGASLTVTAHYKSTNTTHSGAADSSGHASVPFDISRAAVGYTVTVDVSASADGQTATCSTSFTPIK